jgi:hypothetical protein
MKTSTIGHGLGRAFLLTALALAACGPEPGTPDYVLAKLREGRVVGGQNLKLLTADHAPELQALLTDREAPSIARMQALERLIQLEPADAPERFGPLLDDADPEIRLRIIQWLERRADVESARLLIERLAKEQELVVRGKGIRALKRIGSGIAEPDPRLVEALIAKLENPAIEDRPAWASVLGGWHGQQVEAALIKALDDGDAEVSQAAARSLAGPAVRSLERLAPLYVSMLAHERPGVRSSAIYGLSACTHPRRIRLKGSSCTPGQVQSLLAVVPELPQALEALRQRGGLTTGDKRITDELTQCITEHAGADAGPSEPERKGP